MKNAPKLIPAKRPEDYWPLAGRGDNSEAYALLPEQTLHLVRAKDGIAATLKDLKNTVVVFGTPWEPHSATKFGKLKKALDAGEKRNFAIVFVEGTAEQIRDTKGESWYFANAYVVGEGSKRLTEIVGRVPFTVIVDQQGSIESIEEGV